MTDQKLPTTKLRPIYNQIVVLRDAAPVKNELIIIPDIARDRLQKETTSGVVLRVGPGRYRRKRNPVTKLLVDTAERVPLDVRPGDRVWFHHAAGSSDEGAGARMADFEEGERRLTVMWDDEIMAYDGDTRVELELADVTIGSPEALSDLIGRVG